MSNRKNKRTEREERVNEMASELKPLHFPFTPVPQNNNATSPQTGIPEEPQGSTPASQQEENTATPQMDKTTKPILHKYTTHLRADTIKAIKRLAVEDEHKDYEVVQEALDAFFKVKDS